jgi:hypothetical protein
MATLTSKIYENITLNGNDLGAYTTYNIDNINNIDNRTLVCDSGSWTSLFSFNPSLYPTTAGTFSTSSFKYGRVTNLSSVPVLINIQTYSRYNDTTYNTVSTVTTGSSFILSSTSGKNSGSFDPSATSFTFDQYISNVRVAPSASTATIEYYIATT